MNDTMLESTTWTDRLDGLSAEKLAQTAEKQAVLGAQDHDDWALILPPPEERKLVDAISSSGMPIKDCLLASFQIIPNHPSGGFFGPKSVGENYGALLRAHPVYIDPRSSLAGAYMVNFMSYREPHWNPDHDFSHLQPDHERYGLVSGIGGTQHFCQDLNIGLTLGWDGMHKKIEYFRLENGEETETFYDGLEATIAGLQNWIRRHVEVANELAVADSFAALEQRVEQEGRMSWQEMDQHLRANWAGAAGEKARLLMCGIPRFGSGGSKADEYAILIAQQFTEMVKANPTPNGYNMIPGIFSWANTIPMGKTVGATPNGRMAGAPISHGANPDPGFRKDGAPTAMAVAIASVQPGYGNTAPMQIEMDPGIENEEEGVALVSGLIAGHFALGGTQINMNVMDVEKVLAAHEDPSKYPDLVVRVTGFSAYFASLSPEFRQLVVDRIIDSPL